MEPKMTINKEGSEIWKNENGKLHREDGPAVIRSNCTESWFLNGKLHREDGPAVVHPNGRKEWWLNGKRHREDGPSYIHPNGNKEWWLDNKKYTKVQWQEEIRRRKLSKLKF